MPHFYEFFAGAEAWRALGLEPQWTCLWANDISEKKALGLCAQLLPRPS